MIYYVSLNGNDFSDGSLNAPFRTISKAASVAIGGDTVRVFGGVYREYVDPKNGGFNELTRIVYEAVEGEHPVIKGSEIIENWEHVEGTVWKKVIPNRFFGDFNPYNVAVEGDWLVMPKDYKVHLGDVYINGVSMFEAASLADLYLAEKRESLHYNFNLKTGETILHPELTVYQWYSEVDDESTTIWCNFREYDPNCETIEINVRKSCFYPSVTGINYITVRGFEMAQAATPFSPPTGDQTGMIGPHWSKGWIIENNHFHDAKCSAVSLGKEVTSGDNLHFKYLKKPGYQYQIEAVFRGLQNGWSKEKIGSHIVRNNVIHDCGQNGIVGHMGSAFCRIEHNHIYNIAKKQEFFGHEIAGIKFHAAVDTVIENNLIHDCSLGTWLDWQAQGTRITKNVYFNNDRDLMIEVTHGPCIVDNNLLLSRIMLQNAAQGTAYVHNLILGSVNQYKVLDRETPYHFPHTTTVVGYAFVFGGDDRVINNIIIGKDELPSPAYRYLGSNMDEYTTFDEYISRIRGYDLDQTDTKRYYATPQPMWFEGNAYAGLAKPFRAEIAPIDASGIESAATVREECGKWILDINVPDSVAIAECIPVTTERLVPPRITEQVFDDPDGKPVDFTKDIRSAVRNGAVIPGPFASLTAGRNSITVWEA